MDYLASAVFIFSDALVNLPHTAEVYADRAREWMTTAYTFQTRGHRGLRPVTNLTPIFCADKPERVDRLLENFQRGHAFSLLPLEEKRRLEFDFLDCNAERLARIRKAAGLPEHYEPPKPRKMPQAPHGVMQKDS